MNRKIISLLLCAFVLSLSMLILASCDGLSDVVDSIKTNIPLGGKEPSDESTTKPKDDVTTDSVDSGTDDSDSETNDSTDSTEKPDQTVTIYYNPGKGELGEQESSVTIPHSSIYYEHPAPTREGHNFDGWFVDEACTELVSRSKAYKADTTLYAGWSRNSQHMVSFVTDCDIVIKEQYLDDYELATSPSLPVRVGYEFLGWYYNGTAWDFTKDEVDSDITLHAQWKKLTFNITYSLDGGVNNAQNEDTYYTADGLQLYAPNKSGYIFDGWYNNGIRLESISVGTEGDLTLVAAWKKAVIITYNTGNGYFPGNEYAVTVEEGTKSYNHQIPVHDIQSYIFDGWYFDSSFKAPLSPDYSFNEDITLYAKWKQRFQCLDGTYDHAWGYMEVSSSSTCTEPQYSDQYCTVCRTKNVVLTGYPKGHSFGDWVSSAFGETRTCQTDGCGYVESIEYENVTLEALGGNSPHNQLKLVGTAFGADRLANLINFNWNDSAQSSISANNSELVLTATLLNPMSFDRIYLYGTGTAPYKVFVKYQNDSDYTYLGIRSFVTEGSEMYPYVTVDPSRIITEVVFEMPLGGQGTEYWKEIGFFKATDKPSNEYSYSGTPYITCTNGGYEHIFDGYMNETNPTCTEFGTISTYCINCGAMELIKLEKPKGHKWSSWQDGTGITRTRTCTVDSCGATEVQELENITIQAMGKNPESHITISGNRWSCFPLSLINNVWNESRGVSLQNNGQALTITLDLPVPTWMDRIYFEGGVSSANYSIYVKYEGESDYTFLSIGSFDSYLDNQIFYATVDNSKNVASVQAIITSANDTAQAYEIAFIRLSDSEPRLESNQVLVSLDAGVSYIDKADSLLVLPKGATANMLPVPTPMNMYMTFEGWYFDKALTQIIADDYTFNSSITVYAKWSYQIPCLIDRENHRFSAWEDDIAPTCTENGTRVHYCVDCGLVERIAGNPATGHKFLEWQEGLLHKKRSCRVLGCGYEQIIQYENVTSNALGTDPAGCIKVIGEYWGVNSESCLVNNSWDEGTTSTIAPKGNPLEVVITLKERIAFDRIYVKIVSPYSTQVYVQYEGDSDYTLLGYAQGLNNGQSNDNVPFLETNSTRKIVNVKLYAETTSQGLDSWNEIAFVKIPE